MSRDLKTHASLVDRMATRLGVDLEEAVLARRLDPGAIADAVLACADCADPGDCADWLARADASRETRDTTPGYCRNAELLARLKG